MAQINFTLDKQAAQRLEELGETGAYKDLVKYFDNLRDGVFKVASERGLGHEATAELLRAVLIKTAAENDEVRATLSQTIAELGPIFASAERTETHGKINS